MEKLCQLFWKDHCKEVLAGCVADWLIKLIMALVVVISIFWGGIYFLPALAYAAYEVASFILRLAITVRRLRDAGKAWYFIFLPAVPMVGGIILLIFQLSSSAEDTGIAVV